LRRGTTLVPLCAAALVVLFVMSTHASAHKVNLFAYVEGDRVVVEGYFSGKARAQDCSVEVFDERGKKIHEGKTDTKGVYSFKLADLPAFSGSLKIILQAGMGHKSEYTLSAADIPGSEKKAPRPNEAPRENKSELAPSAPSVGGSAELVDQVALQAALETILDKKLEPIVRMLGKQERLILEERFGGPKMTDIIGGIGWIMGLAGLAAFCWGRDRSAKK